MTLDPKGLLPLSECPIGLFLAGEELCLKTEYGNNEGRIDAYIVSSGEFFWGNHPQTIANQRAQMVRPIDPAEITAYLAAVPSDVAGLVREMLERADDPMWADHVELRKDTLRRYATALSALSARPSVNETLERAAKRLAEIADGLRHRADTTVRDWTGPEYSSEDNRANHADARNDRATASIYDEASAAIRQMKEPE